MAMSVHTIEESCISPILQIALGSWRKHCICDLTGFCFDFKDTVCCRVVAALLHDHLLVSPETCLFCAPGFLYFASYTMRGTVWSAGHWHEPFSVLFFFYLKVRRASFIIYQHFLGGHTFFSLLSGLTQLPSVLLSTRGPPVLDNTLHCYMKKNELCWESEILSPSTVCPVSCVLLIAASLYIHAYKLPLLSFIPKKKLNVSNVYYLLISPWILDKHIGREFLESMYYTFKRIKGVVSV